MAKTTTKAKKAAPAAAVPPDRRHVLPHEVVLSPSIQGACSVQSWGKFAGEIGLAELVDGLRDRIKKVQGGDMQPVEAMLFGQAMTLETIFTSLARRAAHNEGLKQFQVNLTLALKAQAQCRATLEALAEIKNPRPAVAFVRQANVGQNIQVNNGPDVSAPVRAGARGNVEIAQDGLLGADDGGNRMDTGTTGAPGRGDPALEAVDAKHRAEDCGR
jgi:hypothetical protein